MSETAKPVIHCGPVEISCKEAAYDERAIARLDSHFQELIMSRKLLCASYLIARQGKIFACKSMGKLTHHDESPDFMPDSIRMIASITKVFTAIAIMQLVEEGKLMVEQSVGDILEEFKTDMHKRINLKHLLTHTSGIAPDPAYFCEPYPRFWWDRMEAQKSPDFPEGEKINWIKALLAGPLVCKPGTAWNYSSSGFAILGEIISRVSGIPCEQYIIEKICKPLGMKETFFDVPEELAGRVCYTNEWQEKKLKQQKDRQDLPPRTGGGLFSTLQDLYKFGQMTLEKGSLNGVKILSRKSIEYMTRNHLGKNVPAFCWGSDVSEYTHGLGFNITLTDLLSPGTFNHEGAGRSMLYMDPAEDLLFAAFTPSLIDWVPESIIAPRSIVWAGLL